MTSRYEPLIDDLREAAQPDRPVPAAAADYVETARKHAYRVTDAQVEAMLAAGLSEDEVFELMVSTAVGAGLVRLDAALGVLG
ncbi:MAG TPA: hypothetical protein VGN27_03725 [Gaiellaceae bacterium]|jgi:alkylhydroperoxidase family enzyme|nr:hypothetical protein [Gaiellaceae bacterium]